MKIMEYGIVREMTAEEEEAFNKAHENLPPSPVDIPTVEDKAEAYDILMGEGAAE